ncbi:MAG: solute:sodium symporter family transporter, partial [Roseibacillus sp.]|nr:solute:sodium symporter family transporter [Roseibacillus sp.]
APIILVLPGIVALYVANQDTEFNELLLNDVGERDDSKVYGSLVRTVLPPALTGFFAAVVVGSILSTFNSVLNSSATLFSLGVYKKVINKTATTEQVVKSGRWCSALVAVFAAIGAPLIFMGRDGIFGYFQKLNGVYFIPLLAVILVGIFNKKASGQSAVISILAGLAVMMWGTFWGGDTIGAVFGSGYHFMGAVFLVVVILQLALGTKMKRPSPYVQQDAKVVDLTPWKHAKAVGIGLIAIVLVIYLIFAF